MSHKRDFVKRRDSTARMPVASDEPRVISCALAWVNDSPEYGRSLDVYPNNVGTAGEVSQLRSCAMTMPFGSPVVPDVKINCIGLSGSRVRIGNAGTCSGSDVRYDNTS